MIVSIIIARIRENGLAWLGKRILERLCLLLGRLVFNNRLAVYIIERSSIRFANIQVTAIGHLSHDMDCFIKEGILDLRPRMKYIIMAPMHRLANPCLFGYWKPLLEEQAVVITSPLLNYFFYAVHENPRLIYDIWKYTGQVERTTFVHIQKAWHSRPPLLKLSDDDKKRGWRCLKSMGIPADAWFICVHCRERGYVNPVYTVNVANEYDNNHSYREMKIADYIPAMKAIVERGGWCIRMGHPAFEPLPELEGVVDYAHLAIRSDWMDVFLCASCRFFLAGSGISYVANVFGKSCARANHAPLEDVLFYSCEDIGIPKLIWSDRERRLLKFKEIFDSPISKFHYTHLYADAGLRTVDNTEDEIRELAIEMLDRCGGKMTYTSEDELLQKRFKSMMSEKHMSYDSDARVGKYFLKKHKDLLD